MFVSYKEKIGKLEYTDIQITRGDGITLILPIFENNNGTISTYTPDPSDVFDLQVRERPVRTATDIPALIFQGSVSVNADDQLEWTISAADTTQNCGHYYWDCQIKQTGKPPFTFYQGWFDILPEGTIPTTP